MLKKLYEQIPISCKLVIRGTMWIFALCLLLEVGVFALAAFDETPLPNSIIYGTRALNAWVTMCLVLGFKYKH
ncbi:hypothetical protein FACS1894216_01420 [Synergistales bacterium]|nr:hypothetical protein FACS1894216_01420 [Synergistales bacterium]